MYNTAASATTTNKPVEERMARAHPKSHMPAMTSTKATKTGLTSRNMVTSKVLLSSM